MQAIQDHCNIEVVIECCHSNGLKVQVRIQCERNMLSGGPLRNQQTW